jgi:hypothetical protein
LNKSESKGNLTEPGIKKASRKKVSWADAHSKELLIIQEFYLDEEERALKKIALKSGGDIGKNELLSEKHMRAQMNSINNELANETVEASNVIFRLFLFFFFFQMVKIYIFDVFSSGLI